jgi:hypothetical protein
VGHHDKTHDQTGQTGTKTGQTGQEQSWKQDRSQDWETETGGMTRGDRTDPAQPDGTRPLERDRQPIDQKR